MCIYPSRERNDEEFVDCVAHSRTLRGIWILKKQFEGKGKICRTAVQSNMTLMKVRRDARTSANETVQPEDVYFEESSRCRMAAL
jgi:hypothetical protein